MALAAAAVVALLGFNTASPVPEGIPATADLITITGDRISRPLPAGFAGASIDYGAVERYAGSDPSAINPQLVSLLTDLAPTTSPVLRIAGDSAGFARNPTWLEITRALAARTHARLILGVNLTGAKRLAGEIRALTALAPRRSLAFELGSDTIRFSAGVPPGVTLAATLEGIPVSQTASFLRSQPHVHTLTFQQSALHGCQRVASPTLVSYAATAHAHGATLRLEESRPDSCGALATLDWLFDLARAGADGTNLQALSPGRVTPAYYGMLAFTHAAPAGAQLLRVGAPSDLRVWATSARGRPLHVVLINPSATHARTVAIQLPAASGRLVPTVERLGGPSLSAGGAVATTPREVRHGVYLLKLAPGSTALLTR